MLFRLELKSQLSKIHVAWLKKDTILITANHRINVINKSQACLPKLIACLPLCALDIASLNILAQWTEL